MTTLRAPSDADLAARARTMVERMAELGRIVYALPLSIAREELEAALGAAGLALREVVDAHATAIEAGAPLPPGSKAHDEDEVSRWTSADEASGGDASAPADLLVLMRRADLGVWIFELRGPHAVDRARAILARVPFVPQSKLLREAIDVASPDAPKALRVLAHAVVAWDDDWTDLFLLHLASPDPIARHNAVACTFLAAMVAGAIEPARSLLREAARREKYPKLRETIEDAVARLGGEAV